MHDEAVVVVVVVVVGDEGEEGEEEGEICEGWIFFNASVDAEVGDRGRRVRRCPLPASFIPAVRLRVVIRIDPWVGVGR